MKIDKAMATATATSISILGMCGGLYNERVKKLWAVVILVALPILTGGVYFGWFYSREKTWVWEGQGRQYRLHAPVGDFGDEKRPLVVALHGYTDHPWFMEAYTGWSAKADREKFFVVYPYGSQGEKDRNLAWNGGSCCGVALSQNLNDVRYVNNLIVHLIENYPIDAERIYVTGFSNGALLAMRMGVDPTKSFAKIAAVAGSIGGRFLISEYFRLPESQNPIDMMLIHGLKDQAVPHGGGVNWAKVAEFEAFSQTANFWARANGCDPLPQQEQLGEAKIKDYSCDGADLETIEIENLGHTWPGGLLEFMSTGKRGDFSATDAIWGFFQRE